jgi:hypothetical protein
VNCDTHGSLTKSLACVTWATIAEHILAAYLINQHHPVTEFASVATIFLQADLSRGCYAKACDVGLPDRMDQVHRCARG